MISTGNKIRLNYFPDDQKRYIDYVIYYEENADTTEECKKKRNAYNLKLISEGFKIKVLQEKSKKSKIYFLLLNCSLDRLMIEAERLKIEIPLKSVRTLFLNVVYCNLAIIFM